MTGEQEILARLSLIEQKLADDHRQINGELIGISSDIASLRAELKKLEKLLQNR